MTVANELAELTAGLQADVDRAAANGFRPTRQDLMLLCVAERLAALETEQTVTANTTAEIAEDLSVCRQDIEQLHEDVREVIAQIGIAK